MSWTEFISLNSVKSQTVSRDHKSSNISRDHIWYLEVMMMTKLAPLRAGVSFVCPGDCWRYLSKKSNNQLGNLVTACGAVNKKTRIVGGQVTYVHQYPWMALLMYKKRFYCGATLINNLYVLTAAHCVHQ